MKKKLLVMLTVCTLAFAMCACGSSEPASQDVESISAEQSTETESSEASEPNVETESSEASSEAASDEASTEASEATEASEDADTLKELVFDIPEGFVETSENYFSAEDTTKASNINMLSLPNDGSFDMVTSELLMDSVETQLESALQADFTLTLLDESLYETADGNRVFRYSFEYDLQGIPAKQLQCIIEAPNAYYFVTFSEFDNEGFFDSFTAATETFRFE